MWAWTRRRLHPVRGMSCRPVPTSQPSLPTSTASQSSCSSTARDSPRSARAMTSTNLWDRRGDRRGGRRPRRGHRSGRGRGAARPARPWGKFTPRQWQNVLLRFASQRRRHHSPRWAGELTQEPDLPPGVMNIVTGCGQVAGARPATQCLRQLVPGMRHRNTGIRGAPDLRGVRHQGRQPFVSMAQLGRVIDYRSHRARGDFRVGGLDHALRRYR
jgi:hypothetical protein